MMLPIYEFSRELIEISCKNGRWVSGGFGAEVGRSNHPVPEKIKDAVNCGAFRLNDSYPPKPEECALIAKEIDEYCVLAVATGEVDDKNRPLVAYRYFWLEKPQENLKIDGIGALLFWWLQSGQPKYEFQPDEDITIFENSINCDSKDVIFQVLHLENDKNVANILTQIKHYPYIVTNSIDELISAEKLHYISFFLHQKYDLPLAWAWNVSFPEKPETFIIIAGYQADRFLVKSLEKYQKPLYATQTSSSRYQLKNVNLSKKNVEASQKQAMKLCNLEDVKYLKSLLDNIASLGEKVTKTEFLNLLSFLQNHSIIDLKKEDLIESQRDLNTKSNFTNVYRSLLALLGFEKIYEWIHWLKKLDHKSDIDFALNIQWAVFELSKKSDYKQANIQLKNKIFQGISQLLTQALKVTKETPEYQNIQWLFFKKSNSVWSQNFKAYTKALVDQLMKNEGISNGGEFYQKILVDLNEKKYQQQQRVKLYPIYKSPALLTRKVGNNTLAALFYQLSSGSVPQEVYENVDVDIIPLTLKQKPRNQFTIIENKATLIIGLMVILIALSSGAIAWIVISEYISPIRPTELENLK
ncbi:hypothetical protein NUACC21_64100 [Scytonema sp. NUACC21]